MSTKKRTKNFNLSSQPLVEEIEDEDNEKTRDDIEIDAMPKLIGMFDEYNNKYYFVIVSFTVLTSSVLLVGIGLGIFYLISNGMCKYYFSNSIT